MMDRDKIVRSAYLGKLFCPFEDVHKYIEEKLGRPVSVNELRGASDELFAEIQEKCSDDYCALCDQGDAE